MGSQLKVAHSTGNAAAGLDMNAGVVGDMAALGIMESYKSKTSSLSAAAEAAEQVIRVDNIIRCPSARVSSNETRSAQRLLPTAKTRSESSDRARLAGSD